MASALLEQLQSSLGMAYTVERELGGGGMSRVFLAVENRLHRRVVVKVLSPDLAAGVSADRFEREIQLAAGLQQANIVPLIAAGDTNGLPYFTMPFVDGESLRAKLSEHGSLPISECVSILRDVARALSYAHTHGVVHRDIKPDNVLLSHGAAVVTDFGIAKALSAARVASGDSALTQTGTSLGSPAYMSPEQVAGDPNVDHRADIYSFGCMGYELLSGRPPFTGESPQRVLAAHVTEKPRAISELRPDVPRLLANLIMSCLAKNPADRPATAAEIVAALDIVGSGAMDAVGGDFSGRSRRWKLAAVAGLLLIAFGGASWWTFHRDAGVLASDKSIAVLPLVNLSGDRANDYFGEGLAEEITGALAKAGLHVVGRSSAAALARKGMSASQIAGQLHVGNVLQGSVQRSGDQIRISVNLMSTPDESVRWSEKYDRPFRDVFAVQDEIAHSVANELQVKLAQGQRAPGARTNTKDPEAYALYLQGLYLWNRRSGPTLRKAISLFQEAVRRDSSYAQAYGAMALAYAIIPSYDDVVNDEMVARVLDAAHHALAIDSTNVEALTALAYADVEQFKNADAERLFSRALTSDSSFATAHFWLALLYQQEGRNEEGLKELAQAHLLEPASLVISVAKGQLLYGMRRYAEADSTIRRVLQLDPNFQLAIADLAKVLVEEGRPEQAVSMMLPILSTPGLRHSEKLGVAAYALARAGRSKEARALVQQALPTSSTRPSRSAMIAAALDALGERETAIKVLEDAVREHDLWLGHYYSAAPYDNLRKEPRLRQLFAAISAR